MKNKNEKMITTEFTTCCTIARRDSFEQGLKFKLARFVPCLNLLCMRSQMTDKFSKISKPQKTK